MSSLVVIIVLKAVSIRNHGQRERENRQETGKTTKQQPDESKTGGDIPPT